MKCVLLEVGGKVEGDIRQMGRPSNVNSAKGTSTRQIVLNLQHEPVRGKVLLLEPELPFVSPLEEC